MIDTLRALTIATNSLRFNPIIGLDTAWQYERVLIDLRDKLGREIGNDPLTRFELREMDGEPVWCVDGCGNACWCLVNCNDGGPCCYDNESGVWDEIYYGMSGDGKHDLHELGWLAYRRKSDALKAREDSEDG